MGYLAARRSAVRVRTASGLLIAGLAAAFTLIAAPAYAASSADLSVTLTNKTVQPGKRVSYVVKVTNHGPSTAERVQIDFVTSRNMSSIKYKVSSGRCTRSPRKAVCQFGTVKPGATATATISGVMSKKLTKGTAVDTHVTLASHTHLVNTADDRAVDNYRIGIAKVVPPPVAPSPAPSHESKIDKISDAASSAIDVTGSAFKWSVVALIAAALWFAVGLTLRARKRRRNPRTD